MKNNIISVGLDQDYLLERFNIDTSITYVDNINNLICDKADLLIINLDNMNDLYSDLLSYDEVKYQKYDLYDFDRLNRKKFKNFEKVYIISLDKLFYKYNFKSLYTNIHFIDDGGKLDLSIDNSRPKNSNIKNNNINKLKEYVDNQKDYFTSIDIMNKFKVSSRWVKRYMKAMNDIYNNIGYSYSKRKWYKVK